MLQGVLIGEGTSDLGLRTPLTLLCQEILDQNVSLDAPDLSLLGSRVGHSVSYKLQAVAALGAPYDFYLVHRDSDAPGSQGAAARRMEIAQAVREVNVALPVVPIVPVRMTEAWLVCDGEAIKRVAGAESGLRLTCPNPGEAERIADPKLLLRSQLADASGLRGRRLKAFHDRFGSNRRRLLEDLDPGGLVAGMLSWRALVNDLQNLARDLQEVR